MFTLWIEPLETVGSIQNFGLPLNTEPAPDGEFRFRGRPDLEFH